MDNFTELEDFDNSNTSKSNFSAQELMPPWRSKLLLSYKIILTTILIVIMVAMGCNIALTTVWQHLKRPIGVAIGLGGQFVVLPLIAVGLAHALSLEPEAAIGTLVIATCPGGTVSNILTYWSDGDVSLSVSMTTLATVMSFGMMPLNLWLYCRWWTSDGATVPYISIVITLASILGPVVLGLIMRWKSLKAAEIITRVGSILGIVCIIAAIIMQCFLFPAIFSAPWQIKLAASCLPVFGFLVAYLFGFICRRPPAICRTVAIETASQNVAMAFSIIALSFSGEKLGEYTLPAMIYGIAMMGEGFIFTALYKVVVKVRGQGHTETRYDKPEMCDLREKGDVENNMD